MQEAYKQLDKLEAEKKQAEQERKDRLIAEKEATGVKPDGWDRSLEYEEKKRADAAAFKERLDKTFDEKRQQQQQSNNREAQWQKIMDMLLKAPVAKNEDLKLADLELNVKQNGIFKVIEDYVNESGDVHRQLECIHSLLKFLHRLGVERQSKTL